jgi:transposase
MNEVEYIRLRDFRQFQKEIRGSREYLIVGIDVAKEEHRAFFGTATGKTLFRRLIFENSGEGFRKLLDQAEVIKKAEGLGKVVFGLEPTADYHKPLGEYLQSYGQRVVLVSGVAVKRNRELLDGRWDKNDTKDAANVADLLSQGKGQFYEYPDLRLRDLRSLLSLKRKLKKQERSYWVRIRNHLLAQYFPELDRFSAYPEVEAIVRWCLDPSRIAGFEKDQFRELVSPNRKSRALSQRLRAIQELAMDSVGCPMGEGAAFEAQVLVEGLRQIRKAIKSTEDQIQAICRPFPE